MATMQPVTRKGDMCTGHGPWPPRASVEGSPNVLVNGIPVHRKNDLWDVHCDPNPACHIGKLAEGSPDILVNGLPMGRVGDPIDCGSFVDTGSPNVLAGVVP